MKKLLFFLLAITGTFIVKGQTLQKVILSDKRTNATVQNTITVDSALIPPRLDTTLTKPFGTVIINLSDSQLYRSTGLPVGQKRWILVGGGSGGSGAQWGVNITGDISAQSDLQSEFNTKQNILPVGNVNQYWDATGALRTFPAIPAQVSFTSPDGRIIIGGTYPNITLSNGITNTNQLTNGSGFLINNQPITISGDAVAGPASTNLSLVLSSVTTADTCTLCSIRYDAKGRILLTSSGSSANLVTSVFGRTGAVVAANGDYTAAQVTNAVSTLGSYTNPSWLVSLPWTKITNTPTTIATYGITDNLVNTFNTRTGAVTLTSLDVTTALGFTPVTNARTITINGTTFDLTANRSWTISTGGVGDTTALMRKANNLADVVSVPLSRINLGLGTAATKDSTYFLQSAKNLQDLGSASTARTNLGLGTAATQNSTAFAQVANNLNDVNASISRTNLGFGGKTAGLLAYWSSANALHTVPITNDSIGGQFVFGNKINFPSTLTSDISSVVSSTKLGGIGYAGTAHPSVTFFPISVNVDAGGGIISSYSNTSTAINSQTGILLETPNRDSYIKFRSSLSPNGNGYSLGERFMGGRNIWALGWGNSLNFGNNIVYLLQGDSTGKLYMPSTPNLGSLVDSPIVRSANGELKYVGITKIGVGHKGYPWNFWPTPNGDSLYDAGWSSSADAYVRKLGDSTNYVILRANGSTGGSCTSCNITWDSTGRIKVATSGSGGGGSYIFAGSLLNSTGTVKLVGDIDAPGNNYFYMTNASGSKTWINIGALPTQLTFVNAPGTANTAWYASLTKDSVYMKRQELTMGYGVTVTDNSVLALNSWNVKADTATLFAALRATLPGGGGGTGSPNSNVGTGYRWAVPNSNNIKTAGFGIGLLADSTTATNVITMRVDTSYLVTKGSIQVISAAKTFSSSLNLTGITYADPTANTRVLTVDSVTGAVKRIGYQFVDTAGGHDGDYVRFVLTPTPHFVLVTNSAAGTVTQVTSNASAGSLFNINVATQTTTPAFTFSLANTSAADQIWGKVGAAGAPGYFNPTLTSSLFANEGTTTQVLIGNATGNLSFGPLNIGTMVTGTLNAAQFPALNGPVTTTAGSLTTSIGTGAITNTMIAAGTIDLTSKVTGVLPGTNGGTGINNGARTIQYGGNIVFSGANNVSFSTSGTTNITLPTSGTLLATTGNGSSLTGIPISIAGTANQVLVNGTTGSGQTGAITLTTPQGIAPANSPTFTGLNLTGLIAGTRDDSLITINASNVIRKISLSRVADGGVYTPVVTAGTNVSAIAVGSGAPYTIIDSVVTFTVSGTMTPTTAGSQCTWRVTMPVPLAFFRAGGFGMGVWQQSDGAQATPIVCNWNSTTEINIQMANAPSNNANNFWVLTLQYHL